MTKLYAGVAAAAVLVGLAGMGGYVYFNRASDAYAQCRGGQVAGGDIGGPFTLVDQTGKTVTEAEVITKPSLVYFGYTFCPDVCPLDNQRNAEAVDILEEQGIEVTPVFISVDPKRDTPEVMADFAEAMHPRMIALTGSEEQVKAASQAYKTYYRVQDPEAEYYLVDHSTFTYLMMPGKGFMDFFKREATADEMAERVSCFVNAGT
ncbi:MAG: SCO family protein [Cereibacter changlensis]|uniref:SCO family protein n=2 Tax=Cereibacter changlensis TaxID=402884 RepID=A0A2T4JXL4_9RHOB|nr:SCO family protein [Cereibacter changlensis]PTE22654.1 SCO family protein [Cereibacter changlensis JA139]PZX58965.1 protein SCO1/2 [Cereibacter changlensis]